MTSNSDPSEHLRLMLARAKVLLTAAPTYLATVAAVLTVIATQIVPLLPADYGAQVAGWVATGLAAVAAVVRVVSILTPADPATYGLLPPSER